MSGPASDPGSDAAAAVAELRILVHRLADEVAAFRRRALEAESRVRDLEAERDRALAVAAAAEAAAATSPPPDPDRAELERLRAVDAENAELRERLEQAAERTRQLLARARFLRQQQEETPP